MATFLLYIYGIIYVYRKVESQICICDGAWWRQYAVLFVHNFQSIEGGTEMWCYSTEITNACG